MTVWGAVNPAVLTAMAMAAVIGPAILWFWLPKEPI